MINKFKIKLILLMLWKIKGKMGGIQMRKWIKIRLILGLLLGHKKKIKFQGQTEKAIRSLRLMVLLNAWGILLIKSIRIPKISKQQNQKCSTPLTKQPSQNPNPTQTLKTHLKTSWKPSWPSLVHQIPSPNLFLPPLTNPSTLLHKFLNVTKELWT